ncbi:DNA polymerase III subunit delta [soil metagenome]
MILSKKAEIDRFLLRPPAGVRAALIHGKDRGGVHERADLLASKVTERPDDPFNVALLTEADIETDPARLEDELTALSMTGGRRLVRLRLGEKVGAGRTVAEALKRHCDGELNPDAFLLIEGPALEKSSPVRKAAEAAADACAAITVYEDETGDVSAMVREALGKDRVSLTPDALSLFVGRLPKERGVARQEIERLILFLGPVRTPPATPADLDDFLGVEPEASLFDAASDAFGGRLREAQSSLRRARAEGEGGPAAVRALSMHAGKLRKARILVEAGAEPAFAAKQCGVFWKQEREFLRHLRSWRTPELEVLSGDLLAADRACKTAGSPDHLIAERLALTVAGRARRLGL